MVDILKALSVDVHCDQCGEFNIGADVIAESQRLLDPRIIARREDDDGYIPTKAWSP